MAHDNRHGKKKATIEDLIFEVRRLQYWAYVRSKQLRAMREKVTAMANEVERLTASVARETEVDASAVALIEGLAQQIRDNANNPAALNKLADDLDASSSKLAESVAANTPAEPPSEV